MASIGYFGTGVHEIYDKNIVAVTQVKRIMDDRIAFVRFEAGSEASGGETGGGSGGEYSTHPDPLDRITHCGPYRDYGYGFQASSIDVQIPVRGNVLGTYFKVAIDKKNPDEAYVQKIETIGGSDDIFLLGIEYNGVHEYFSNHNRVTVFTLAGEMLITRALVKIYSEDDIHQGDDYVISENKDFVIDINGLDGVAEKTYDSSNQTGENEVGNGDTRLDFIDIGCLIYDDGSIRNIGDPEVQSPETDPASINENIEWGTGGQ